jgi:hypothetical protein
METPATESNTWMAIDPLTSLTNASAPIDIFSPIKPRKIARPTLNDLFTRNTAWVDVTIDHALREDQKLDRIMVFL